MTLEELNKKLDEAEIRARSVLVSNLFDEEFLAIAQQGPAFHDTLVRAQDNGWIHYTRLAEALGIAADAVLLPDLGDGDPHTAALPHAYDRAVAEGSLAGYTGVLFVAAGSGPAAAATLYRLPALAGALA